MFVINHSDTNFVINYAGQEKTLPSEEIVYVDEAWISWDTLHTMFGHYVAKVDSSEVPEEMLYDNQIVVKNNTIYRVEEIDGIPSMFVSNGIASLYFAEGIVPEKLSELTPIRRFAQCTGYQTMLDMADYLAVVAEEDVKITFTGLKLTEMPTTKDTPQEADPYKPLATVEELEAAKSELTEMILALPKFEIKIVTSLPATGEYLKLYLIKATKGQTGDAYDEYIWIDSLKKFEWIGTTRIDLTNYYTKGEVDAKKYVNETTLASNIQSVRDMFVNYYTKTEIDAKKFATQTEVNAVSTNLTSNYYDKTTIDSKGYLTEDSLGTKIDTAIDEALVDVTDGFIKEENADAIVKNGIVANSLTLTEEEQDQAHEWLGTADLVRPYIVNKQDIITGSEGEVLYHSGTSVLSQTLLNEGMIVTNTEEMDSCKVELPSFKEVFESWRPYSHLNGTDNASASELAAWVYDESLDTIRMPMNSTTVTGYVSPKTYSKYDITVRLYSDDSDDDQMGIVGAFAVDSEGKEHTLTFIASPYNNTGKVKWCCKVDHCVYDLTSTAYDEIMLMDKTSTVAGASSTGSSWKAMGTGIVINVKREGNVFTATCSQFKSTTLDPNTTMVIDLDALSATYPVLNVFKGSAAWGYMSMSQPNSCYENVAISNDDGYIFDVENDQVLEFDNTTQTWVVKDTNGVAGTIGAGRFSFNKKTGKLFYSTGKEIIHIGSV